MEDDPVEDDLGEDGGRVFMPHAADARLAVQNWRIRAVGRRPKDYLARDLLFGSSHRDPRLWKWRKIMKHVPRWMYHDTYGREDRERKWIGAYRGFHFLHLEHLARMADADEEVSDFVMKLWNCWPTTVLFGQEGDATMTSRNVCDLAWHCPFCLSRNVIDLYDRLRRGPWAEPDRSFLLLVTANVSPELLEAEYSDSERLKAVRRIFAERLREAAEEFGVTGGISVVQPGPYQRRDPFPSDGGTSDDNHCGFEFRLAILGEVPAAAARKLLTLNTRDGNARLQRRFEFSEGRLLTEWHIRSSQNRNALRTLLFGTVGPFLGAQPGHSGLFVWPSWILSNSEQWRRHRDLMRGQRMFNLFGTWRGQLPDSNRHHSFPTVDRRRRRQRNVRQANPALRALNHDRRTDAIHRRELLADELSRLFSELREASGRVAGHRRLRDAAALRGLPISERDARWIAARLRLV